MKIKDIKIGQKLFGSFIIVIIIFGIIISYQIMSINKLKDLQHDTVQRANDNTLINQIDMRLDEMYGIFAEAIIYSDVENSRKEFMKAKEDAIKDIENLHEMSETDEEKRLASEVESDYKSFLDHFDELFTIIEKKQSGVTGDILKLDREVDKFRNEAAEHLAKYISIIESEAKESDVRFETVITNTIIFSVIISLAGLILSMLCAYIITNGITKPVRKVVDVLNFIGKGDFTKRNDVDQKDEIGAVAKALNNTAEMLEKIITNIVIFAQKFARGDFSERLDLSNRKEIGMLGDLSQSLNESVNNLENLINEIAEFAKKFAQGDLTERLKVGKREEVGMLGDISRALNEAVDNLENLISNVIVAIQSLVQAVEQIASGNQSLSQRTSEQASSLEEIASTIEETTATIKQNADNAENANKMSENTSKMAEDGAVVVGDAVDSINEISQSSKKIGEIISMINEISFQTNLLALNAAVEAARAGEQGRGFAVVAGEVRNLAQRSATAAKEIGVLINDSIEKIDNGTELVNRSGEALKEITTAVKDVGKVVSEIAAASIEQRQGVEQVNKAVTEMDTMTQQNAALVEETASASEEMSNQAQDLMAMVENFKVQDTSKAGTRAHKQIYLSANDPHHAFNKEKRTNGDSIHRILNADKEHKDNISKTMKEEGFEEF